MLTLIEPPGAKRGVASNNRSAQHLLTFATGDDDDDLDTEEALQGQSHDKRSCFQKLDGMLVGKSNSNDFSDRWKKEFSERPSWCDADMTLQQINMGKAKGNRVALYSRSFIQKALFSLGSFVERHSLVVICLVVAFFSMCCYGLQFIRIETDIVKLWVARGGRLDEELNFLSHVQQLSTNCEMQKENGLGGGYQVVIHTPEKQGDNMLSKHSLLEHVSIMEQIATYQVELAGENWTLSDICFKPPTPDIDNSTMAANFIPVIERIIPCIWITPIDCFWEGAKAVGPHPNVKASELGLAKEFLKSLPSRERLSWANLDPLAIVDELDEVFSLGDTSSFFRRADIGMGYLDRWCIDPLDPQCPQQAPNHFPFCELLPRFLDYANQHGIEVHEDEEYLWEEQQKELADNPFSLFGLFSRRKRETNSSQMDEPTADASDYELQEQAAQVARTARKEKGEQSDEQHTLSSAAHESNEFDELYGEDEQAESPNVTRCRKYAKAMSDWMRSNKDQWSALLEENEYPHLPDYGKVLHGGCRGFAKGVMSWPQDLIIGGVQEEHERLQHAEALQSVFLVASPNDVYLRYKDGVREHVKHNLNATQWNVSVAEQVIKKWQRQFTHAIYNHPWNFMLNDGVPQEHRRVHPLASTSIADMLEEFCQFNYTIIIAGYLLMLVYALQAQMRHHGCMLASDSCVGLAFAGVLTVTFASVAGLGLATWFGIEFNAATTQIVPFLTLGIGVDNMFLLLHNYHGVVESVQRDEVGHLMKETGMSVLMTSINNILSFLAGTLLPIPALRGFCAQSSILLTFNLMAILTIYPAIISLDLRRRKSTRRDVCCCVFSNESVSDDGYTMGTKPHVQEKRTVGESSPSYHNLYSHDLEQEDDVKPWTLHAFLRHYYIPLLSKRSAKAVILAVCGCLLIAGLVGMHHAQFGLELSDVLPEHTAPAAFLKARDRYFSFYPMFAVLKGPHIDYARDQHKIDNYRKSIGRSRFVVKVSGGEPSEKYWLSLMRAWLRSLQTDLDQAIVSGQVNVSSISTDSALRRLSPMARMAYRLVCSVGDHYRCSTRIGKVRLVDESGTINVDGFYNYLTAWYNSDSMMYHVSQASFFPAPPKWSADHSEGLVPAAEPFSYSQIPFYLTGLTDTPVIVEMIKEIRVVCDRFSQQGLPNFPSGIAFTFWEQYLHLSSNLAQAICVIAFAVFFVISLIICNPWAAGTIMIILLLITVELAGFLGLAGIKLNPVSAVTIITAVGIGVEFTAHVVLAFLTSLGTREERMRAAVDRVFVPVIHGAFSTLLGIIMLSFSEFEFVVKYFFVVMTALIAIGVLNGLALLPVLLSLLGPPCEVTPVDGGNRLAPPPSLRRKVSRRGEQEMQTHRRNDSDDSNTGTLGPETCSTMLLIEPPHDTTSTAVPRLVPNSHARSASAHIAV